MPQQTVTKTKIRKKSWYPIVAPKIFSNASLGETLVYEPNAIIGKQVRQSLMNLTNDIKKQSFTIDFEVEKIHDNKGLTSVIGYNMVPASVKRLVRRNSDIIQLSFECKTSDNKTVRIKPFILTLNPAKGSVTKRLRKTILEHLAKTISGITYDNLVNDLINHSLQSKMKMQLKKIYPLRICEIKHMGIVREKKPELEKEKTAKKAETKEGKKTA